MFAIIFFQIVTFKETRENWIDLINQEFCVILINQGNKESYIVFKM